MQLDYQYIYRAGKLPEPLMAARYSIVQIRKVCSELEGWIEQTEDTIGNEEDKATPNEDRLELLGTRLDALQSALDSLQEIE